MAIARITQDSKDFIRTKNITRFCLGIWLLNCVVQGDLPPPTHTPIMTSSCHRGTFVVLFKIIEKLSILILSSSYVS